MRWDISGYATHPSSSFILELISLVFRRIPHFKRRIVGRKTPGAKCVCSGGRSSQNTGANTSEKRNWANFQVPIRKKWKIRGAISGTLHKDRKSYHFLGIFQGSSPCGSSISFIYLNNSVRHLFLVLKTIHGHQLIIGYHGVTSWTQRAPALELINPIMPM